MTADLDIAVKPETPGSQCQSFVESADLATLCMIRRDPVAYQPTEARLAIEKFDRRQRIATQQIDRCVQARRRSEEHTSELQSLMRISYAVFCLKNKREY